MARLCIHNRSGLVVHIIYYIYVDNNKNDGLKLRKTIMNTKLNNNIKLHISLKYTIIRQIHVYCYILALLEKMAPDILNMSHKNLNNIPTIAHP